QIGALAHGIDHARFLGDVLDPGTVVLGVHRELGGPDLGGSVRTRFERISDDDRYLVLDLVGGTGGNEQVRGTAPAAGGFQFRGLRFGERKADLVAAGRGGIRAPVCVLAEQSGLRRIATAGRRRHRGRGRLGGGGSNGGLGGRRRGGRRRFGRLLGKG